MAQPVVVARSSPTGILHPPYGPYHHHHPASPHHAIIAPPPLRIQTMPPHLSGFHAQPPSSPLNTSSSSSSPTSPSFALPHHHPLQHIQHIQHHHHATVVPSSPLAHHVYTVPRRPASPTVRVCVDVKREEECGDVDVVERECNGPEEHEHEQQQQQEEDPLTGLGILVE
ncbi:hypothetical protein HDU96_007730, partial [Phlyctochytrium bullatum]